MKKKTLVAVLSATMLTGMGTGVLAASNLQEIKAYLNPDIRVQVDGTYVDLRDNNGNALVPINYEGANYFPIRAISDALNVAVEYDAETQTIILGEKVDGVSVAGSFNDMYHTKDPAHTTYKGYDYKEAYFNNTDGNRSASFMLHPKKQYQTLYLQVAAVGGDYTDIQIRDSDSQVMLKSVEAIKSEDGLVTMEVDIGGVDSIYVSGNVKSGTSVFVPLTTSYFK